MNLFSILGFHCSSSWSSALFLWTVKHFVVPDHGHYRFLYLSHRIMIWQLRPANALLNIRLQGIFREVLDPFHTSSAWKMLLLHLIITAASSDSALYSNWAHMNQFNCLHFKDEENKAQDAGQWHSTGKALDFWMLSALWGGCTDLYCFCIYTLGDLQRAVYNAT